MNKKLVSPGSEATQGLRFQGRADVLLDASPTSETELDPPQEREV